MKRASRRRKRQRNHRRTVSVIAALFLVFQLTVMPWPEAYAAQDLDISSTDSEINDLPEEEAEEEPEEEPEEEAEEEPEEEPEEQLEEEKEEPDPEPELAEEADEENPEEEKETAADEDELEEEEKKEEESEDIAEQEVISENGDEPGSEDPDDPEEEDGEEAGDEEDDNDAADESGVFELTEETDGYTAVLCFDSGISFPEGSVFTVSLLTEEEEEAYPEYCRLLSEAAEAEEVLLGFYAFAWEIPEDVCSGEELFLTLMLKGEEYTEREYRAYVLEEDRFAPSENTEVEEDTFCFTYAGQGLYALTAAECEQKELPPVDAGTDSLLMTDCLNSEEPEEAEDSNVTAEEKEAVIPAEEETKEKVMESPLKRMLIKNPAAAVGDDVEEDIPLRGTSAGSAVIQRDICRMQLSAEGFADSDADHVMIDIKDQNGDVRDTLTLSAENGWTTVWEAFDVGDASFTAEETGIYDSSGRDLTDEWDCSAQTSQRLQQLDPYSGWEPADGLEVGTYTIAYKIGERESFLAADKPEHESFSLGSNYTGWMLTSEPTVSASSTWNVIATDDLGAMVTNEAVGDNAYLSARHLNKKIFAVINVSSSSSERLRMVYDNGILKAPAGTSYGFLQAKSGGIKCADTWEEATQITLYRSVTYQDMVHESSVCFSHIQKPPPVQNTTVTIRLTVGGNMREWDRAFPFTAAVDDGDPVSFTLMHAEEFELENIPIGAKLTVAMLAQDYEVTSVFGDVTEGESSLTLSSVPEEGGTILFQADRSVQLSTGVRSDSGASHMLVLMAVFLCFTLQFVWNRKILSNNREENDL